MAGSTVKINGVTLLSQSDMVVAKYLKTGVFEPKTYAKWIEYAKEGRRMVDIGCYSGIYAIGAALAGCPVIAFDLNEVACARTEYNATLNRVMVSVRNVGLGENEGMMRFYYPKGRKLSSAMSFIKKRDASDEVMVRRLDDYELKNVACIKIDAERSELLVLSGAKQTLLREKPALLVEQLDPDSNSKLATMLGPLGYNSTPLDGGMALWEMNKC